jgi:hypothetical protein
MRIQIKGKVFVHATADVSERGKGSIHLDARSIIEIQVKRKAFVHATADVSERGIASIHLDIQSIIVKM